MGGTKLGFICLGPFADLGMRKTWASHRRRPSPAAHWRPSPWWSTSGSFFSQAFTPFSSARNKPRKRKNRQPLDKILMVQQEKLNKTVAQLKEKAKSEQAAAVKQEVEKALATAEKDADQADSASDHPGNQEEK
ncbi:MAG: hypothetical protein R2861_10740 [Desulfobacterales bacterium]